MLVLLSKLYVVVDDGAAAVVVAVDVAFSIIDVLLGLVERSVQQQVCSWNATGWCGSWQGMNSFCHLACDSCC